MLPARHPYPTTADFANAMRSRFQNVADPRQAKGLVGFWPLTDGAGTTARDWSGRSNHGTLTDMDPGTDWVPTNGGVWTPRALDFDGSNDNVLIGASATLDSTTTQTLSTWIRRTSYGTTHSVVVSGADTGDYQGLRIGYDGIYYSLIHSGGNGIAWKGTASTITTATWTHLAVVRHSNSSITFYRNGTSESATVDYSAGSPGVPTGNAWRIGYMIPAAPQVFAGDIADVRIYNRDLSASEIRNIYYDGGAIVRPRRTLVGWTGAVPPPVTVPEFMAAINSQFPNQQHPLRTVAVPYGAQVSRL